MNKGITVAGHTWQMTTLSPLIKSKQLPEEKLFEVTFYGNVYFFKKWQEIPMSPEARGKAAILRKYFLPWQEKVFFLIF